MPFSSTTMRKPGNIRKSKIHKHCRRPSFYKPKIYFSTRMIEIQNDMSERAIELLALPDDQPCFVLDIGCGSGLSGECLDEQGHYWIGIDISISMLSKQQIYLYLSLFPWRTSLWQILLENVKLKETSFMVTWAMGCPSVPVPSMEPSASVLSNGFVTRINLIINQLSD